MGSANFPLRRLLAPGFRFVANVRTGRHSPVPTRNFAGSSADYMADSEADTLGSLIDPRPSAEVGALIGRDMTTTVGWNRVRDALVTAHEADQDAETVLGHTAEDVVNAAALLGGMYTLVATNPPFLNDQKMSARPHDYCSFHFPDASAELAVSFVERAAKLVDAHGVISIVLPARGSRLALISTTESESSRSHRFECWPTSALELSPDLPAR